MTPNLLDETDTGLGIVTKTAEGEVYSPKTWPHWERIRLRQRDRLAEGGFDPGEGLPGNRLGALDPEDIA